jgi:hypothetical protein
MIAHEPFVPVQEGLAAVEATIESAHELVYNRGFEWGCSVCWNETLSSCRLHFQSFFS